MKKKLKRFMIIIILPVILFVMLGLFQGIWQITYHSNLIVSLESFRMEPPYCFVYFTPPNGNEEIVRVIGAYQINNNNMLVFAENDISDITVSICKIKDLFDKKCYKTVMICGFLSEKESLNIEFDNVKLSTKLIRNKISDCGSNITYLECDDSYIEIKKTGDGNTEDRTMSSVEE